MASDHSRHLYDKAWHIDCKECCDARGISITRFKSLLADYSNKPTELWSHAALAMPMWFIAWDDGVRH